MSSSDRQNNPAKKRLGPYELAFGESALKEWGKLTSAIQLQFSKKLKERLQNPRVQADQLRALHDCYKIKLRASGFRLVYQVLDDQIVVKVITVGKRNRGDVYSEARKRI